MVERTLPGNPPVSVTLRRSARARRFSLRVSRLDGRVTLSIPARASEAEALAFAGDKADWVRSILATSAPRRGIGPGSVVPFEGRALTVTAAAVRAVRVEGDLLLVPGDPARMAARIAAFLKLAARQRLQAESERFAAAIGRPIRAITLRDTRSRWGSCTHDGRLMYSWRLIMAPPEVLSYVAAHEVAHLKELNHSADFWAIVARLMPDHARHRRWLRGHGNDLHRIDFGGSE
ncbi:MAG TPA: SprT family zinc-dependent metalloprotease [Albidovulum sp.]|uniref:M48 family metallopeptidase n=1 Tax=Albidovulum sp. TaxID=1872424 RepID=UPI002C75D76B|nr:SprT family zinc-dependent metalloprotease [Albidovulum sp.]